MKVAAISGTKTRDIRKKKINELPKNSKEENIKDLYRGINTFKWATTQK
jgi:hypothetical protein